VDTFTFTSGITIAPAKGTKRRDEEAKIPARARWGAAAPPAATGHEAQHMSHSVAVAVPRPTDAAATEAASRDAGQPASQRRRVEEDLMPHSDGFESIDCGGDGDCGFLAFARATHDQQDDDQKSKVSMEDFKPKGPVQAELRLLAASELEKNYKEYLFGKAAEAKQYANKVGKAGFYADSRSMYALAQAAQVDLRIFAYSDEYKR
jgi:hypothetical protein